MGRTFYTSDPHFSHERIIELCGRPFKDVQDMNSELVERWNSRIRPSDTVHVLGDVCLGSINESLEIIRLLNGRKILTPGNHDRCFEGFRDRGPASAWRQRYLEAGFSQVTPTVVRHYLPGYGEVTLSHFPYAGESVIGRVDRWANYRPRYVKGSRGVLIHGHVHNTWKILPSPMQINVGMDQWDFAPVSSKELVYAIRHAS